MNCYGNCVKAALSKAFLTTEFFKVFTSENVKNQSLAILKLWNLSEAGISRQAIAFPYTIYNKIDKSHYNILTDNKCCTITCIKTVMLDLSLLNSVINIKILSFFPACLNTVLACHFWLPYKNCFLTFSRWIYMPGVPCGSLSFMA